MRSIKPNTRRSSPLRTLALVVGAIAGGGAVTVAVLGATNVIDLGKLAFWRPKAKVASIPPGYVGIPLTSRPIPAYTAVTKEYLMNQKKGDLELKWVPKEEALREVAREGLVIDFRKIIDRVTTHEIPAIHNFHESDFAPVGTRPGISAGVPPGKRAYVFNASSLDGCVYQVKEGDHVDLMVSVPVDMPGAAHSGASGASVIATPDTLIRPKRTLEIPLVQDGVVVLPVTARETQVTNSSVMNGATVRKVRVEEIVIAVSPKEVAPLDEAKALKHKLTCVARSGIPEPAAAPAVPPSSVPKPAGGTAQSGGMSQVLGVLVKAMLVKPGGAAPEKASSEKASPPSAKAKAAAPTRVETPAKDRVAMDITPGFNPMAEVRYMEVMIGATHKFILFNGPGNSPVVAAEDDGSADAAPPAASKATPADAASEEETPKSE